MQAGYLDYAPTARWSRSHLHSLHRKRVKEIRLKSSLRIDRKEPESLKILPKLKRDFKDMHKERNDIIQRENTKIILKLSQLASNRKNSSKKFTKVPSMTLSNKKKEAERISEENQALVRRLQSVSSFLKNKYFSKDHQSNLKYKKNISKRNVLGFIASKKKMGAASDSESVEEPNCEELLEDF